MQSFLLNMIEGGGAFALENDIACSWSGMSAPPPSEGRRVEGLARSDLRKMAGLARSDLRKEGGVNIGTPD